MRVRAAERADVPDIVAMGLAFLAEEYAQLITPDAAKLEAQALRMIGAGDLFVLEDRGGALVGMIGVVVYDHFLGLDRVISPVCWWVNPGARGRGGALLWRRGILERGREVGASRVMASAPNERTERMYALQGMQRVEVHYTQVLR